MTTSKTLTVYLPYAARTKRNFVQSRLRCYLNDLIAANNFNVVADYAGNHVDIIHFPSVFDYMENDNIFKEKNNQKKYIINAFNSTEEFEFSDKGIPHIKKDILHIFNRAFTVIVFFENQKIALRHLGVTSPIQIVFPVAKEITDDTEIYKTAFYRAYGMEATQKFIVNLGSYYSNSGAEDYESLARIIPDIEFYFFGNRPPLFYNTKRYEESKTILNLHFEDYPPEELLPSMLYSMMAFVITGNRFIDSLFLADCMKRKVPIIINTNIVINEMLEGHTLIAHNLDEFYNSIHDLYSHNKKEEAYKFISQFTVESEKDKIARIYDKYLTL